MARICAACATYRRETLAGAYRQARVGELLQSSASPPKNWMSASATRTFQADDDVPGLLMVLPAVVVWSSRQGFPPKDLDREYGEKSACQNPA